jgi:hypothetical protein
LRRYGVDIEAELPILDVSGRFKEDVRFDVEERGGTLPGFCSVVDDQSERVVDWEDGVKCFQGDRRGEQARVSNWGNG